MIFRRTKNGLSNLKLFFGVDVVVYVEGGCRTISLEELSAGLGHKKTDDTTFWGAMFDYFRPKTSVHILSVGSKTTLLEIADLIKTAQVSNVYVAMDRDYDNYTGRLIVVPGVIYTKGYSFENDIWNSVTVLHIFRSLCPHERGNEMLLFQIDEAYKQFHKDIRRAIRANVALAAHDQALVFGDPAESFVVNQKKSVPQFNLDRFKQRLRDRAQNCKCFCPVPPTELNNHDDCHGKVAAVIGYRILLYVLSLYADSIILPKPFAKGLAITHFERCLRNGDCEEYLSHYTPQFACLPI